MKQFNNYAETKSYSTSEKLPAGGYVAKVLKVKYDAGKDGKSDRLTLSIDIAEGDYQDFFKNQFENNTSEDKKWKGNFTIYCPTDDGSERDNWTKRKFKTIIEHFEQSNAGYTWDWDESKLTGKYIGLIYGEINTVIEGNQISYVGYRNTATVDAIRAGKFNIPEPQYKNGAIDGNASSTDNSGFMPIAETEAEALPFN